MVALLLGLACPELRAQDTQEEASELVSRLLVYSDDDATTVTSTLLDAQLQLPDEVTLGAHALLDAVSSASVDVVSAATKGWQEERVELGLRAGYEIAQQEVSLALIRSEENDWRSHAMNIGTARELFERNTRVSLNYGYTSNQVGRAKDPVFLKSLRVHGAELGVTQLVDRRTRVGLSYTLQLLHGFQASPYRYVSASDGSTMAEVHPDRRQRHALSGFAQRAMSSTSALRVAYRLYRDDWGILSHTTSLGLVVQLADRFVAELEARFYQQNRADFYRRIYPTSYRYMSSDRELSTFWDVAGQARVSAELGPATFDLKLGAQHYRFRNFDPLSTRRALLVGAGARLQW